MSKIKLLFFIIVFTITQGCCMVRINIGSQAQPKDQLETKIDEGFEKILPGEKEE